MSAKLTLLKLMGWCFYKASVTDKSDSVKGDRAVAFERDFWGLFFDADSCDNIQCAGSCSAPLTDPLCC